MSQEVNTPETHKFGDDYGPRTAEDRLRLYAADYTDTFGFDRDDALAVVRQLDVLSRRASAGGEASTAPRNGDEFIARNEGHAPFSCQYWKGEFVHLDPDDGVIRYPFTHWAPLAPSPSPAPVEGWVIVPKEPTKEMRNAIAAADWQGSSDLNWDDGWRIMLAAAPALPKAVPDVSEAMVERVVDALERGFEQDINIGALARLAISAAQGAE